MVSGVPPEHISDGCQLNWAFVYILYGKRMAAKMKIVDLKKCCIFIFNEALVLQVAVCDLFDASEVSE